MKFKEIINNVPKYKEFLTVEELDKNSRELAEKYPNIVELNEIGKSTLGNSINCLKIGNGSKNALAFACAHPNEPIGTMTLEYLSSVLAENDEFLEELDYTWYIIKSVDPDGTKLNEGWFKGPFTILNYAENYYRPAGSKQVEWSFPIEYKELKFTDSIDETKVLMKLIDEIKPDFMASLHNGGFGGAFWYISKENENVYKNLAKIATKYGVPLNLGEPEIPFSKVYSPAVYQLVNTKDMYDFYEKYVNPHPANMINCGTTSDDYANSVGNTFTLITELPYFYDTAVDDETLTEYIRKDIIIEGCNNIKKSAELLRENFEKIKIHIPDNNLCKLIVQEYVTMIGNQMDGKIQWAENNIDLNVKAKKCEVFDSLYTNEFYSLIYFGLFLRMVKEEIDKNKKEILEEVYDLVYKEMKRKNDILEKNLNYIAISIDKLVKIQLESILVSIENLK